MIAVIILMVALLSAAGVFGLIFYAMRKQADDNYSSQTHLTDKELFLLIQEQPDGIMTSERLAQTSGLTLKQAKSRLSYLSRNGLFNLHQGGFLKSHYSLKEKVDDGPSPKISDEPFLTVEDILLLFKHHDYKLTYQKICMSTGLPVSVIKEELEYFKKQKIISSVYSTAITPGVQPTRLFLLEEPYRSSTDKFLEREQEMNLELKKIYLKETRES